MNIAQAFAVNTWQILLEASPWLLVGLVVSGFIKAAFPTHLMARWLGGHGVGPVFRAAFIGTPLPLCSCSVLPAAITLRRAGASKGATASFLVATPENGVDSIALSYALLGPFMTIVRPLAAILSAIFAGLLTDFVESPNATSPKSDFEPQCRDSNCHAEISSSNTAKPFAQRLLTGLNYAVTDLLADIAFWLLIGILLAAAVNTVVPPRAVAEWGSGLPAMTAMLLVGIPMYICASASTPVAAAMLIAGVSPGTVLVFLLAGPATNVAAIGIVRRELGTRSALAYLLAIAPGSIALGLLTDALVRMLNINVIAEVAATPHIIPTWTAHLSVVLFAVLVTRILIRRITKWTKAHRTRIQEALHG